MTPTKPPAVIMVDSNSGPSRNEQAVAFDTQLWDVWLRAKSGGV